MRSTARTSSPRAPKLGRPAVSLALVACTLPGCFGNFDPALYRAADGGSADAGPARLLLADFCTDIATTTLTGTAFAIDTTRLADDVRDVAGCLGRVAPGNDGFVGLMMTRGDRWHFHVRQPAGSGVDPMLYVLDGCDERNCDADYSVDACGADANEHLSFVAPHDGVFYVGVDTAAAGGFAGTLEVYRPTCGNGTRQHSENCDDGNLVDGDGCDALCRTELSGSPASETETNDDFYAANHVLGTGERRVLGEIGTRCDADSYAFDVAAGATLSVAVLPRAGGACPGTAPIAELTLHTSAGVELRAATPSPCPSVSATVTAAGTYFVRLYAPENDATRTFAYELVVTETP